MRVPTRGMLVLVVVIFLSFVTLAVAYNPVPLTNLTVLVKANTDNTTVVTFAGQIDPTIEQPYTTRFLVPADFKLTEIWQYDVDTTNRTITAEYTTQDLEGWREYTVDLDMSDAIGAEFHLSSAAFDPTAMGEGAIIASMEVMAPSNLAHLAIGFEAPTGFVGAGADVVELGVTEAGIPAYGMIFEDIAEGEVVVAQVAFVTENRYEEATGASIEATPTVADWFTTDRLVIGGIVLATLAAIALLVYLLRRQNRPKGRHSAQRDHSEDELFVMDED